MTLMNLTKEVEDARTSIEEINSKISKLDLDASRDTIEKYNRNLTELNKIVFHFTNYISDVLDAIIELYKREDKQVVGVPYKKDYVKHRKALDSLVFSKEGNIVHLQIREDMDKSSYKITVLENDQLKAERL